MDFIHPKLIGGFALGFDLTNSRNGNNETRFSLPRWWLSKLNRDLMWHVDNDDFDWILLCSPGFSAAAARVLESLRETLENQSNY